MITALITGSAGFAGQHLTDRLKGDGHKVVTFDLAYDGDDIRDYEAIRRVVEETEPDLIFHLAAQAYVPEATTSIRRGLDVNTIGTLNLLEAVRHTGSTARILLAGTSEEYGYQDQASPLTEEAPLKPTTPYGVSKAAASLMGRAFHKTFDLPVVVTRAWNHTGPGQPARYAIPSFARRIAEVEAGRRHVVEHGNLAAVRNYTDVRDIVDAYVLAIGCEPGVYNLCSGWTVNLKWVLDTLISHAAKPIHTTVAEHLYRPNQSEFPTPSCEKFKALTGWEPRIPFTQTLADTLDYWRSRI